MFDLTKLLNENQKEMLKLINNLLIVDSPWVGFLHLLLV